MKIDKVVLGMVIAIVIEASRGAGAQSVTVKSTSCGFDPHSRR